MRAVADAVVVLCRAGAVDAIAPWATRLRCVQTKWLGWRARKTPLLAWMADNHAATRSGDRIRTPPWWPLLSTPPIRTQLQRRRALGARRRPSDPTTALLTANTR